MMKHSKRTWLFCAVLASVLGMGSAFAESKVISLDDFIKYKTGATGGVITPPAVEGANSLGIGDFVKAKGDNSIAIGDSTDAQGVSSTVIGYFAQAQGGYSNAIGNEAKAAGDFSNVIGSSAEATGNFSNAIGYKAKANTDRSVALGAWSEANIDLSSRATDNEVVYELSVGGGKNTTGKTVYRVITNVANGTDDHDAVNKQQLDAAVVGVADTYATKTELDATQAELNDKIDTTKTYTKAMIEAKAEETKAELSQRISPYITDSGLSANSLQIKNLADGTADTDAATVGQVKTTVGSLAFNAETKKLTYTNLGAESATEIDLSSLAGGGTGGIGGLNYVAATQYNSPNNSAFAMAQQYDGGGGATALGYNAKADAAFATALGWGAQATRLGAIAIGSNSVATRDHALAVGDESKAEGENSTALGYMNEVNLGNSAAVGYHNVVAGSEGAAFGAGNNITGLTGIALGSKNVVSGDYAITLGSNSKVQEDYAVAMGSYAFANGAESMALGRDSQTGASAVGAMAFGSSARATGANALALGSFSESAKRDYAVKYCKELIKRVVTEPPEQGTAFERTIRAITGDNYEEWLAKDTDTFINDLENALPGGLSFKNAVMPVVAGNEDGNMDGTTASGLNAIAIGASTKPQGNMASGANSIAIGTDAQATAIGSVAIGANSVATETNTVSVGNSTVQRRIVNVAAGTADTDAATVGQVKAKTDYYVKGGNVRVDTVNNKKYLDLQVYNNTSGGDVAVDTVSIDMSSLGGGGGISSGDKILTPGTNIGFTEYVDTEDGNKTKYRVDLIDTISGLTSLDVGTETNHIYLDKDGVSVTEATSLTTNHKTVGMTPEKIYIGEGLYNTSTGRYEGVIYSSLSKDELKVNQKIYINGNGINANGQKISNVAAGTTDTDGATYGQVKGAVGVLSLSLSQDKKLSLMSGQTTLNTVDLSGLGGGTVDAYTKTETDAKLADKANTTDVYSKTEVDTALGSKANTADVYAKTDTYSKMEVNTELAKKADKSTTLTGYGITDAYTKTEVDGLLAGVAPVVTEDKTALGKGSEVAEDAANATAIGSGNKVLADSKDSTAVGKGNEIRGERSTAIGNGLKVHGKGSGAFGDPTVVNGDNSYSVGNNNYISADSTYVFGSNVGTEAAPLTAENSVVLGNNSFATIIPQVDGENGVVSVGAEGKERRITNVRDGVLASDAATYGQLERAAGQLSSQIDRMGTRINKVGAGAAALAAMHPVYDEDCKL
ncbi:MAG: hypothetical protein MJ048_05050, partial [Acidaminococcaceae bacterium]|nr:hypothetical protein [Acidaminococcaceae bacterium]